MRSIVDQHSRFVARTLQKAGVPRSELDDEIQRTFIVVAGRLDDVKLGAEQSFLFRVAVHMAAHARRTLARRREILSDQVPERVETIATPDRLIERKQTSNLLDTVVGSLSEPLRAVFTLYEFEGMDRVEIAAQLGVPRGTVASRLRRARAQFRKHAAAVELAPDDVGAESAPVAEPRRERRQRRERRESAGALSRALLATGSSIAPSGAAHARTLAALGLAA